MRVQQAREQGQITRLAKRDDRGEEPRAERQRNDEFQSVSSAPLWQTEIRPETAENNQEIG